MRGYISTLMSTHHIGSRINALREERKLSQHSLARLFGFKDRQTVSAIETGVRRVTAEELLLAVEKLNAQLVYFTDPFLLAGAMKSALRAHALNRDDVWVLCGLHNASLRFGVRVGLREHLVSWEDLLDDVGHRPNPPCEQPTRGSGRRGHSLSS